MACTLDIVGDRWTLLVFRDLVAGKQRFDQFLTSPEQIATSVLADRLARLEREGLVSAARDPEDGRRVVYTLTARGRSLSPVMLAIRDWGLAHLEGTSTSDFDRTRKALGK